jgi:hypothetical protein
MVKCFRNVGYRYCRADAEMPNDLINGYQRMKTLVRARHENSNVRIKEFVFLSNVYRPKQKYYCQFK